MTKRTPKFDDRQLGFTFEPVPGASEEGALAGLDAYISSAVGRILRDDPRSRFEVAGGVSALLGDDVSKSMLDAYSAEAKDTHNISLARFLALIAETQRYDVLDKLCQRIGAKVVVGQEILTVELGHIKAQKRRLTERERVLEKMAPEIGLGAARK